MEITIHRTLFFLFFFGSCMFKYNKRAFSYYIYIYINVYTYLMFVLYIPIKLIILNLYVYLKSISIFLNSFVTGICKLFLSMLYF